MLLFFLVLQLFFQFCYGDQFTRTANLRTHQASLTQLKCDSLPFRSYFNGGKCYFAVSAPVPFNRASALCDSSLFGAVLDTSTLSRLVLVRLFLDSSKYHNENTKGELKGVLCRYDNPTSCDLDENAELPGKCIKRVPVAMPFAQAAQKGCENKFYRLPLISNDHENRVIASLLSENEQAWVDVRLNTKRMFVGGSYQGKAHYLRWFFGNGDKTCKTLALAVSGAKREGTCTKFGQWITSNIMEKHVVFCVRDADGDFVRLRNDSKLATTTRFVTTTTLTTKKAANVAVWTAPEFLDGLMAVYNSALKRRYVYTRSNVEYYWPETKKHRVYLNQELDLGRVIGNTLHEFETAQRFCSDGWSKMRLMEVVQSGVGWEHRLSMPDPRTCWLEPLYKKTYMGFVSITEGTCGATVPVKKWRAGDGSLYYGLEDGKDHGIIQDGGKAQYYIWPILVMPHKYHLLTVVTYFNNRTGTHAYCLDQKKVWSEKCVEAIEKADPGFDAINKTDPRNGKTTLGKAIDSSFYQQQFSCQSADLFKLGFIKSGKNYVHSDSGQGLLTSGDGYYYAYASRTLGTCLANVPIKRWQSKNGDIVYGADWEWHPAFKGMVMDGGKAQFYLWDL